MPHAPRFPSSSDALPATLPVFPLPGALLLPGGKLPLQIFEPRYLAMTRDALASDRLIGIHRRLIVNVNRVAEIAPGFRGNFFVTLAGGKRLEMQRSYADRLRAAIRHL